MGMTTPTELQKQIQTAVICLLADATSITQSF